MSQPLDDYLARVARQLRALPPSVRENELREMGWHLEQLSEDFEAQGLTPAEAQRRSAEAFGSPKILGAKLCDAWEGISFSWWRVTAVVFGITTIWLTCLLVFTFSFVIIGSQSQQALFPEVLPILGLLYASVPFGCGLLFSHWLGRRGRLGALLYFALMLLVLHVNLSFKPSDTDSVFDPPDLYINYINASWLPLFNVALAWMGATVGHTRRMRALWRLAPVGVPSMEIRPIRIFFVPLHLKTWGRTFGLLGVGAALFAVRVWLTVHPKTPIATLRNSLIMDSGPSGFDAPTILQLKELPPQTLSEIAGHERRVQFRVEARAKRHFAANQIRFLRRTLVEESRSKYGVDPRTRDAIARVQANQQMIQGTVRLVKIPNGWKIDEKSFDRSKLWSWFYIT